MALGIEVVALHVNHRLNADADRWQARAAATCRRWARRGAPLGWVASRVDGRPTPGESVEAWARQARYRALRQMALGEGVSLVLLAHHQADQAETFLLQALRGAGVAGLAAMPRLIVRDGITWGRPWLGVARGEIEAYLRRHRLAYVDDASNAETRYARNRLRHEAMPALVAAFADAPARLARAAEHLQEAASALSELAEIDLAAITAGGGLLLAPWRSLSPARRSNALRSWLKSTLGPGIRATLVARLLAEWPAAGGRREWPCRGGRLLAWRGVLRFDAAAAATRAPAVDAVALEVDRPGSYRLAGWAGSLIASEAAAGGVAWHRLADLRVSSRSGGEQFQPAPNRPARSLKKQFQAAGVPPERRSGPVFHAGELLVYVAGLGVDARALAPSGERQAALAWIADRRPQPAELDTSDTQRGR